MLVFDHFIRMDGGRQISEGVWKILTQTLAFDPVPQFVSPLLEIRSNEDSFTGRLIEGETARKLLTPDMRFTSRTSGVGRLVGSVTRKSEIFKFFGADLSGPQIDHLIKSYAAGFGVAFLTATDAILVNAGMIPSKPAGYLGSPTSLWAIIAKALGASRFLRDGDLTGKQSSIDFYKHSRAVNQVIGSVNKAIMHGWGEEAARILEENQVSAAHQEAFAKVRKQVSKISRMLEVIMQSDADSETKGKEEVRLNRARTVLMKRMVDMYDRAMRGSR